MLMNHNNMNVYQPPCMYLCFPEEKKIISWTMRPRVYKERMPCVWLAPFVYRTHTHIYISINTHKNYSVVLLCVFYTMCFYLFTEFSVAIKLGWLQLLWMHDVCHLKKLLQHGGKFIIGCAMCRMLNDVLINFLCSYVVITSVWIYTLHVLSSALQNVKICKCCLL